MRVSRVLVGVVLVGLMTALSSAAQERQYPARPSAQSRPIPNPAGPKFKLPPTAKTEIAKTDPDTAKWIVAIVVEASRKGTALFNDGNAAPAYLYYEATLNSVFWFILEDDLRGRVQRSMYAAAGESWEQGAVILRTALNDVRNRLDLQRGVERSLFERLGGRVTVQAVVKQAYDKASAKDSKVNLDRNGEFPYSPGSDRALRMQKATVVMIERLSKHNHKETAPAATVVADPKATEQTRALKDLLTKLNDQLREAGKKLAELPAVPPDPMVREAAVAAFATLHKQIAAIEEVLKTQTPVTAAPKTLASGVPSEDVATAIRAAHKNMRITDEEYDAALKIFSDTLAQYSVPDQEIDELIVEVEGLRKYIVAGYSPTP